MGIGPSAATEQNTSAKEAQKDNPWRDPRERVQSNETIEFVTKYGGTYLGRAGRMAIDNRSEFRGYGDSTVFIGETEGPDEFFAPHLVQKWRVTDKRVEKDRLIGITNPDAAAMFGYVTPIFLNYLRIRQEEKQKDGPPDNRHRFRDNIDSTHHYLGKDGKRFWRTQVFGEKSTSTFIVEIEGRNEIEVHFDSVIKTYSFRDVAKAVEAIYNYVNDVPVDWQ